MQSENLRAILSMLGAVGVFSLMDATMKLLSVRYPPLQVASMRAAASLPFILAPLLWSGEWSQLRTGRPILHALRGLLGVVMLGTFVFAVSRLSLANTNAVYLCAPLLVAALSAPLLGERVTPARWIAILVGLAGVLFILRPTGAGIGGVAGLAAAVSTLCYALSAMSIRILGRTDSNVCMVTWFMLSVALGAAILAWPQWRPIMASDWGLLLFIGITGAAGQHLLTDAFRRAPPTVVAPFEYTVLLWAMGLDRLIWEVYPTPTVLVGGAIVIASGLYVIWQEKRPATVVAGRHD
jgi:drug/metabolite transporter (DMT)-like permease